MTMRRQTRIGYVNEKKQCKTEFWKMHLLEFAGNDRTRQGPMSNTTVRVGCGVQHVQSGIMLLWPLFCLKCQLNSKHAIMYSDMARQDQNTFNLTLFFYLHPGRHIQVHCDIRED